MRPRCTERRRTEDRFPNCVTADSKLSQRRPVGGPSAESAAATARQGSCPTRAPSSSEALVADRGRRNGVPRAGRRRSFAQSARVARPGSNPSHGAHHRGAQKPVPIEPRIAVIITGPQTIIISGGSANSASSTHQLVRTARTTTPVTAAAAAKPPTIKSDEIRGQYRKPFTSTLTGSGFAFDSLVDTVTTSNRWLALVLSQRRTGRSGRGVHVDVRFRSERESGSLTPPIP
jgi:hypothetical protein